MSQRQRRKSGCQAEVTAVVPEKDDGILNSNEGDVAKLSMYFEDRTED